MQAELSAFDARTQQCALDLEFGLGVLIGRSAGRIFELEADNDVSLVSETRPIDCGASERAHHVAAEHASFTRSKPPIRYDAARLLRPRGDCSDFTFRPVNLTRGYFRQRYLPGEAHAYGISEEDRATWRSQELSPTPWWRPAALLSGQERVVRRERTHGPAGITQALGMRGSE